MTLDFRAMTGLHSHSTSAPCRRQPTGLTPAKSIHTPALLAFRLSSFIRMQVALMEHGMDDSIRYTASMAHHTLFHKLGLKLPGM